MSAPAGIFHPRVEKLHLALGLALVTASVVEAVVGWEHTFRDTVVGNIFARFLFFNATHIAFSFTLILLMPEGRRWLSNVYGQAKYKFWLPIAGINLFAFAAYLFAQETFHQAPDGWIEAVVLLNAVLTVHHGLAQSLGLSSLYNRNIGGDEKSAVKLVKLERKIFWTLILLFALSMGIDWIDNTKTLARAVTDPYRWTLSASGFLLIATLIGFSYYTFGRASRSKCLFLTRLMLWPLLPFSTIAAFGLSAYHGTEYFLMFRQMRGKSPYSKDADRRALAVEITFFLIAMALGATFYHVGFVGLFYDSEEQIPMWSKFTVALYFGLLWTHYYIDSKIYRFSTVPSQQHILPLVTKS